MKYNNITKAILLTAVVGMGTVFTSCKDEPDKYEVAGGTPTVDFVRCLSSEIKGQQDTEETVYTNGQLVESASPQQTLCLVGKNLRSITEMYFNDRQAILNSSYITDNTLIVDVPRSVPKKVTNKIYMVTSDKDTVTYDFKVVIPSPVISSMSCEYADTCSEQTLTGQYFIDDPSVPLTVSFTGAGGSLVPANVKKISDDYTTITFDVPKTAVEGPVTVSNIYGTTTSSFYYKDSRGMLFDFDYGGQLMEISGGKVGHGWHYVACSDEVSPLDGNYIQLGDGETTMTSSLWGDNAGFSFEYWPGNWEDPETYTNMYGQLLTDKVDFSDWENMAIKFEMYIPSSNPWSQAALQIIPAGVTDVSYGNAGVTDVNGNVIAGCNNTYISGDVVPRALYRPWTETGSYDTGDKWVTVTIPLQSSLIYGASGAAATGKVTKDSFTSLVFFLCGGGVNGTDCKPIIRIDNIRAVPMK